MAAKQGKRFPSSLALLAVSLLLSSAACSAISGEDGFSDEDWKLIKQVTPLSTPMPENRFDNRDDDVDLARFGQALFFESDLSEASKTDGPRAKVGETGKFACVTCHDTKYFTDSLLAISQGGDHYEQHNSPSLANVAWWDWYLWTGLFDSLMMHGCFGTFQEATPLAYAHYVYKKYKDEYNGLFPDTPLDPALADDAPDKDRFPPSGAPGFPGAPPGPWEMMTDGDQRIIDRIRTNIGRAFDAYPRHLVTRNSRFEQYIAGTHDALSSEEKRGLRLFIGKAACNDCHNGPLLSDQKFHNIGVPTPVGMMQDPGQAGALPLQLIPGGPPGAFNTYNGAGPYSDDQPYGMDRFAKLQADDCDGVDSMGLCKPAAATVGAFRTASLLNIAETGPYFHTGEAKTLEDVVWHYNNGGGPPGSYAGTKSPRIIPLNLTAGEISDLVAFLHSLTGEFVEPDFAGPPANPKPRLPAPAPTTGTTPDAGM